MPVRASLLDRTSRNPDDASGGRRALLAIGDIALKRSAAVALSEEGWQVVDADSHLSILCHLLSMLSVNPPPGAPELVICDRETTAYLRSLHWNEEPITLDEEEPSRSIGEFVSALRNGLVSGRRLLRRPASRRR